MRVSIYKNATSTEPKEVAISAVLKGIEEGRWEDDVQAVHIGDYSENKKKLPGVTFSGTFTARRIDGLIEHSGFICLDWDKVDAKAKKEELKNDPFIYAAFTSPSGEGVKALIKIPKDRHTERFKALNERFPDIDLSGKDVSRLCFVSYDPDLYLNENSEVFNELPTKLEKQPNDTTKDLLPKSVKEGERNNTLARSAGKLIKASTLSMKEISDLLWQVNQGFEVPLPRSEFDTIIKSISRYDQREDIVEDLDIDLGKAHLNNYDQPELMPVILRIRNFEGWEIKRQRLFTTNNISSITGQAKSKKTMLVSVLIAAFSSVKTVFEKIEGCQVEGKPMTMYFDTEQARYDTFKVISRIKDAGGDLSRVNVWCLREYTPKKRVKLIERALEKYAHNTGLVVIDGIADLVNSINDEEEANKIVSKLMKWTAEYNLHILTVIHQNKSGEIKNPRGHIGTAVMHKSECIIEVKKNEDRPEISVVKCQRARSASFKDFDLIIENGKLNIDSMQNLSSQYKEVIID